MSINLQYGIFPGSTVEGPISTNPTDLLCVEDGKVSFLSGSIWGESDWEIGKLLTQGMYRIVLFQEDSGFVTVRVVNLLKTIEGAEIIPFPTNPKLKGHILVENIKEAALDYVRTLCPD